MKKDESIYLRHIMDAIGRIEEYTKDSTADGFLGNKLVQAGAIRELEIIGEAVKRLSHEFKATNPSIPWKIIAGSRDKLIHDYFGVDLPAVWDTIRRDIPELKGKIQEILKSM